MKKFYSSLIFFILLFLSFKTTAQTDTIFWFAPPDVSNQHDHSDNYIEIRLANADTLPVTVTISQPANPGSPINTEARFKNFTIPVGEDQSFNLSGTKNNNNIYKALLETQSNGIQKSGLLIKSSGLITAYYEVGRTTSVPKADRIYVSDTTDKNGEIFTLKGTNALGTNFYTPFQNQFENHYKILDANSSFDIVATEDNTKISFYLTKTGKNNVMFNPGNWYNDVITLQKGETFSVVADGRGGDGHMTGSQVKSSKPIAITLKDDSDWASWDTGTDIIGDQLVPVSVVGKEYIVVRGFLGPNNDQNTVFVVPTQNGTNVSISGAGISSTQTSSNLAAGSCLSYKLPGNDRVPASVAAAIRIESNFPVYVYYVSGYGSEMGGPLLPPINCTGSSKVTFVRSSADPFFLTVIAQGDDLNSFSINKPGVSLSKADFTQVPGSDNWWVAQKEMNSLPVNAGITIQNTKSYFHLGIINGLKVAGTSRFGYFSDYGKNGSSLAPTANVCPGSTLQLDPKLLAIDPGKTFWYKYPDVAKPVHTGLTYSTPDTGKYFMSFTDKRSCNFTDSIVISHYPTAPFNLGKNFDTVCSNTAQPIVINGTWKTFNWTTKPAGVVIPATEKNWTPAVSGIYAVEVSDANNCRQKDSVNVTYVKFPKIDFGLSGDSSTSCGTNRIILNPLKGDLNYNYAWTFNGTPVPDSTYKYTPAKSGKFKVIVSDKKYPVCRDQDEANIVFSPNINILFSGDTGVSCFGSNYKLCADPGHTYNWKFDNKPLTETGECISPKQQGKYALVVTDKYRCTKSDSIYIKYFSNFNLGLYGKDTIACYPYNSYKIKVFGGQGYTYTWSPAVSTTDEYTPSFKGDSVETFKVKVSNLDGCSATDSVRVRYGFDIPLPKIPGGDTTACQYANYTIDAGPGFQRYEWSDPTASRQSSTYAPQKSGKYWVTVYAKRGGCNKTSDTTNVKYVKNIAIDLGEPDTQCSDFTPIVLDAGTGFQKYEWENNPAATKQFYQVPFPEFNESGLEKTVTVKGTYEKICVAEGKKTIRFIKQSKLNLGPDTTVCAGTILHMSVPKVYENYLWTHPDPRVPISSKYEYNAVAPGLYTLVVSSVCGTEIVTKLINHRDKPKIDFGPSERVICLGSTYDVKNIFDTVNAMPYTYQWRQINPEHTFTSMEKFLPVNQEGIYVGTATDITPTKEGYQLMCQNSDTLIIKTTDEGKCFVIPNLITPNKSDTINNAFHINGIMNGTWRIEIYNRWGERVFESQAYNNDWKADNVGDGVYFYNLENPKSDRRFKGWVQVVGKE